MTFSIVNVRSLMKHYGKAFKAIITWKGIPQATVSRDCKIPLSTLKKQFTLADPDFGITRPVLEYLDMPLSALYGDPELTPLEAEIMSEVVRIDPKRKEKVQRAVLDMLRSVK